MRWWTRSSCYLCTFDEQLAAHRELLGDDHAEVLDRLTRSLVERDSTTELANRLQAVRSATEGYHRNQRRIDALEQGIEAHRHWADSVRSRPRAALPEQDPGYRLQERKRALDRMNSIRSWARSADDYAIAWQWTDPGARGDGAAAEFGGLQGEMIRAIPETVARTVGFPREARHAAMRVMLRRDQDELSNLDARTAGQQRRLDQARSRGDLLAATERWAAQVPGHPAVQMIDTAGTVLVIGDLDLAEEVSVHAVEWNSSSHEEMLRRAAVAAVGDVASATRPAAAVVWIRPALLDQNAGAAAGTRVLDTARDLPMTLAQSVAEIVDARAREGYPVSAVRLIGYHDDATVASNLVSDTLGDDVLTAHREQIVAEQPDQAILAWLPSHRVEGGANNCFPDAAHGALQPCAGGTIAGSGRQSRHRFGGGRSARPHPDAGADVRPRVRGIR